MSIAHLLESVVSVLATNIYKEGGWSCRHVIQRIRQDYPEQDAKRIRAAIQHGIYIGKIHSFGVQHIQLPRIKRKYKASSNVRLVQVDLETTDKNELKNLPMPDDTRTFHLNAIYKIVNRPLAQRFRSFCQENKLSPVKNSEWLIHGTSPSSAQSICQQGWKLECAKPLGFFGHGIYFSIDINEAMCYSFQEDKNRKRIPFQGKSYPSRYMILAKAATSQSYRVKSFGSRPVGLPLHAMVHYDKMRVFYSEEQLLPCYLIEFFCT